jgi:hypothetical protein
MIEILAKHPEYCTKTMRLTGSENDFLAKHPEYCTKTIRLTGSENDFLKHHLTSGNTIWFCSDI